MSEHGYRRSVREFSGRGDRNRCQAQRRGAGAVRQRVSRHARRSLSWRAGLPQTRPSAPRSRVATDTAGAPLIVPPAHLCTDNGAMVAWAGAERLALVAANEFRLCRPAALAARAPDMGIASMSANIRVIGAGAWGTALAQAAVFAGHERDACRARPRGDR